MTAWYRPSRLRACYRWAMTSIVLVDDHAIVREGFKRLIEAEPGLEVIAECGDAEEALETILAQPADLVVLDLSLPNGGGLPLLEHLLSVRPRLRVVVLSMHDSEPYISEALRRGAWGYVSKSAAAEELIAGLREVLAGRQFLSSDIARQRANRETDPMMRLTAREQEVFLLLARGLTPKQTAAELGIGQKTVYIHRASLMGKLGAGSELDLYRLARERGLVTH